MPGSVPTPVHAAPPAPRAERDKLVAALLAFLLGIFGAHRFYLGRNGSGMVMTLLTLLVVGSVISWPWSIVDVVRLLFMTNRDFVHRFKRLT